MAAETQARGPVNALYQRGPRGQCNCNMISTWKNTFLPGKSYCICRTQNAIYIATHTALLLLRERVNPCALMIGAYASRFAGGAGRIRIRAGLSGGGRLARGWRPGVVYRLYNYA